MKGSRYITRIAYRTLTLLLLLFVIGCGVSGGAQDVAFDPEEVANKASLRPNIVFILTDDMTTADVRHMPYVKRLLTGQGTTFGNAFVTNSVCCPSRTTVFRGQYTHNHRIEGAKPPAGGWKKFRGLGYERSTVATWLRSAGYRTVHIGKYLNGYTNTTHVPPGWDEWYGFNAGGYYNFKLNENGRNVLYKGEKNYQTDVLNRKAVGYIRRAARSNRPFFMHLAPWAPHGAPDMSTLSAPRHRNLFRQASLPRPPSFNERDVSDKPRWVRGKPRLSRSEIREMSRHYRMRLRSLQAVDESVRDLVRTLRRTGQLQNTYIVFTTDNGFHMGQHRLSASKWTAYEEDIRVPLIVRGPGVPAGRNLDHLVINNDFAPTFAVLGRAQTPAFVDGRPLVPLLGVNPPPPERWRRSILIEAKADVDGRPAYKAVRTDGWLYVKYSTAEQELYDLRNDPYQLHSLHASPNGTPAEALDLTLQTLSECAGEECRRAEDAPPEQ